MDYLKSTISVHHIDNWVEERFGDWQAEPQGPQRYFTPTVQDTLFSLPGTGAPGSECGEDVFFWCKDCDKLFTIDDECGERECPHCSHIWARNEAEIMRGRLWDGRRHYYRKNGKRYRLHHCIVSYRMGVPRERRAYRNLRGFTIDLVRSAGLEGGCVVFHPWRESRDGEYSVVGPHFHIFGLGSWVKSGTEVEPYNDDILFKRVRDFNARQKDPFEYVLTHCGIAKGIHAVVWFGCLAYNKMPRGEKERAAREEREIRRRICPHCGRDSTDYVDTHVAPGVPWDREGPTL